jgi:hypothetical protein
VNTSEPAVVFNAELAAAWMTVVVCPLTVMIPVRSAVDELFAAARYVRAPLPVPEAAEIIVSQEALLTADQANPLFEAVTVSDPNPPAAGTFATDGLTVTEPKALSVTAMVEGNPRAWRLVELYVEVLDALSTSVIPIAYTPAGLNWGRVKENWNTGLIEVPPVMGRLCLLKTVVPD